MIRTGSITVPVHQLPTSCHVCGAAAADTGRPACTHDWTNAEALAEATEHDRRYLAAGGRTTEARYVEQTRGR